jgi:hypothetical protein
MFMVASSVVTTIMILNYHHRLADTHEMPDWVWAFYFLYPALHCTVGWVDIGTRTKVSLKFVTYLSKITKINEKSVLTQ